IPAEPVPTESASVELSSVIEVPAISSDPEIMIVPVADVKDVADQVVVEAAASDAADVSDASEVPEPESLPYIIIECCDFPNLIEFNPRMGVHANGYALLARCGRCRKPLVE